MNSKTRKSIRSAMKSHTRSIQDKSRLLVQCILEKDPLTANKIFPGLVSEAEALRQLEVKKLIFEDDEDDFGDDDDGGDDDGDDEGDDEGDDDEGGDDEDGQDGQDGEDDAADGDTDKVIDDAVEIQCQINAKVIENLFDVIADLKTALNDKDLDETSKDFIVLDTTISYYSDKLQELQAQTNPGTDQSKLEEKLDTISKALEELKAKAGVDGNSEESDDEVDTPDDVDQSQQGSDEEQSDEDEESDEDQDQDTDQQDEGDEGDEGDEEDEDQDQQQSEDQE